MKQNLSLQAEYKRLALQTTLTQAFLEVKKELHAVELFFQKIVGAKIAADREIAALLHDANRFLKT